MMMPLFRFLRTVPLEKYDLSSNIAKYQPGVAEGTGDKYALGTCAVWIRVAVWIRALCGYVPERLPLS
jgi:hypothetical protein